MIDSPESSIVKVLYGERGKVVGAGVLIGEKWVLTCRHVIESVLSYESNDKIYLTFYLDKLEKNQKSHILFLANEGEPDIAILELEEKTPSCASIGTFAIKENFNDLELKACGFSSGKEGEWVSLTGNRIVNSLNYFQIDVSSDTGYKIEDGFSGTPVFDAKSDDIVGIVVSKERKPDVFSGCFISIKSIINVCNENPVDQSIFESVKYLDPLKTPLGKIANLIVESLRNLSVDEKRRNEIIRCIVDKCNIEVKPWLRDEDLCFPLAMAMLNLGLVKSLRILIELSDYISPEDLKSIFNLLVPSWVDSKSAADIAESALNENNKNAVALNGDKHSSAKMCVNRASGHHPGKWPTYSCLGSFGVNAVDDIVNEIERLWISYNSKRGFSSNKSPHQIRTELKMSIEFNKKNAHIPTFFIFNYSKNIVKLLPSVQDVFPHITLFLLTGNTYPQLIEFRKLDCKCLLNLGLDAEQKIIEEINCARICLGISDLNDD